MMPLGVIASAHKAASGGGGALLTYLGNAASGTDLATYTFAGMPFGPASASREIIVTIGRYGGGNISSATIGGVAATIDQSSLLGNPLSNILRAAVPAGTSGDVVLNFAAAPARVIVGVYASTVALAVSATATLTDPGQATASITNPAGSEVLAAAYTHTLVPSWVGATSDYAATVETVYGTAARTAATGALTITAAPSSTTADAICAVAYAPA